MAISLPDARHLSDEVLEALRLRAVHGLQLGYNECQMADLLGVARETVCQWWCAFRQGGLEALPHERSGRPTGSGRSLSYAQAHPIQEIIDTKSPQDLGIAAPLWTRRAVAELIRQQTGIDMPLRTVGLYLKRWGYTVKRPQRRALKQNPDEVRAWLEKDYPALAKRAAAEGAEIHWGDETGVVADAYSGRGYARVGAPAILEVPEPHIRINMISTVTNEGTVRFMTYSGMMTAALFLTFLKRLIAGKQRKIFLIVDRLRAHDAASVLEWLASRGDRIEVHYMPRRSPELNVDEYFNNDLKGQVHQAGLPTSKGELTSRVKGFMKHLARMPEHIKSYFEHSHTRYAAGSSLLGSMLPG